MHADDFATFLVLRRSFYFSQIVRSMNRAIVYEERKPLWTVRVRQPRMVDELQRSSVLNGTLKYENVCDALPLGALTQSIA